MEDILIDILAGVPRFWSHYHYNDERVTRYDSDFIRDCVICQERFELAIEENRACRKHPGSYYESSIKWCEGCEGAL